MTKVVMNWSDYGALVPIMIKRFYPFFEFLERHEQNMEILRRWRMRELV